MLLEQEQNISRKDQVLIRPRHGFELLVTRGWRHNISHTHNTHNLTKFSHFPFMLLHLCCCLPSSSTPFPLHTTEVMLYDRYTNRIYTIISQVTRLKLYSLKKLLWWLYVSTEAQWAGVFDFNLYVRWAAGSHIKKSSNFSFIQMRGKSTACH